MIGFSFTDGSVAIAHNGHHLAIYRVHVFKLSEDR